MIPPGPLSPLGATTALWSSPRRAPGRLSSRLSSTLPSGSTLPSRARRGPSFCAQPSSQDPRTTGSSAHCFAPGGTPSTSRVSPCGSGSHFSRTSGPPRTGQDLSRLRPLLTSIWTASKRLSSDAELHRARARNTRSLRTASGDGLRALGSVVAVAWMGAEAS